MSILALETLQVTRDTGGSHATGRYVPSLSAPFAVQASVQPMTPETAELLPEGARTTARLVAYSADLEPAIRTVDLAGQAQADRIAYRGRTYVAMTVADWTAHQAGIPHRAYALVPVGADE